MSSDIITLRMYRQGEVQEVDPQAAMTLLFGLHKLAGHEPRGSTERFQATISTGDTIVFEVQNKREVS